MSEIHFLSEKENKKKYLTEFQVQNFCRSTDC